MSAAAAGVRGMTAKAVMARAAAAAKSFILVISTLRSFPGNRRFWPLPAPFTPKRGQKLRENGHTVPIFGLFGMLNEFPTQSGQSLRAGPSKGPLLLTRHPRFE